ncbi:MAG TPA: DUF3761 domain-containing protein [Pyrinomonadaceae bacterium]|jgi:hypothetical protein
MNLRRTFTAFLLGILLFVASALGCPKGYYKNSEGRCVRRPTVTKSAPAGATARCRDGSYSFSRNHRGTCSHHGGVAEWLD